ncbi:MAG: bacillithiol biosynthesis deacetylase BshB1 [Bacteroidota bacterium]|jgi:bacillithiol biosynthesis deacetylase BshB1
MNQLKKVDILAFGAHPDDVELGAGGTLLKHIQLGYTAGIVDLTQGELGSRGSIETRKQEATQSAAIFGLSFRTNLKWQDGFFAEDDSNLLEIAKIIRQTRPSWIMANAISDRHPDHGRGARIVERAAFLSGLTKIKIEENGEDLPAYRPNNIYHYIQDRNIGPQFVVDITNQWEIKMKAIAAFKSQFYSEDSTEPVTPISTKEFWSFLEARARDFGRIGGFEFAEGFTTATPLAIRNFHELNP